MCSLCIGDAAGIKTFVICLTLNAAAAHRNDVLLVLYENNIKFIKFVCSFILSISRCLWVHQTKKKKKYTFF